jgi:glycosyltransferase involved in cell wall biosynthesis
MLRIALDVAPLHGHRTGVGTATEHLLRALGDRPDLTVEPYLVSYRASSRPGERRLPLPAAVAMRLWARSSWPRADRWLRGTDVVHGTNYTAPPSSLPTVISVYDCWFLAHPERVTPDVRRAADVLRRAVDRGAWIHTSSTATEQHARELLATDRIQTIHLGPIPVDAVHDGTPAPDAAGPFLLALGTVERRKGIPRLVDAFGRLPADLAELRLVIAGAPGDDQDAVDRAIATLPADRRSRVTVSGPVDAATKAGLLRGATALAYPSRDEGFGFPVLEAQSVGTPVIATAVGSIPEIAGDGADLVPLDDVDALAAALTRVVTDEAHRHHLVAAGWRNVRRFSWERTAASLADLYRAAVLADS